MRVIIFLVYILLLSMMTPVVAENCHLRVGWEEWYPSTVEPDGTLAGSEFSLITKLSTLAGCELSFVKMPWARGLVLLESGGIDMLFGAGKTSEREKYAVFSKPYRSEQLFLITRKTDCSESLISLSEWLSTKKIDGRARIIGTTRGVYYSSKIDPIINSTSLAAVRLEARRDQQLLDLLMLDRIDGYLIEASIAPIVIKLHSQSLQLKQISESEPEPIHLMFSRKVSLDVIDRFNGAITALSEL